VVADASPDLRRHVCGAQGDNAHAESFWHSLKAELTRGVVFLTDEALRTALRHYIRYYNRTRLHFSLNYTSPIAFERSAA
jgi:putative transposase